jgi:hypothetical protein
MTAPNYDQLIMQGIKGLPSEALVEIADFVYFVRKRVMLQGQALDPEVYQTVLRQELAELNRDEAAHLEKEFEDYERLYPRE